jgi:hypothetical protein
MQIDLSPSERDGRASADIHGPGQTTLGLTVNGEPRARELPLAAELVMDPAIR